MKLKRIALGAIMTVGVLALAACGGSPGGNTSGGATKTYELKMSTQLSDTSPMVEGFKEWGKKVQEKTNGGIKITVFASATLGSDEDVIEQAVQGVGVAVLTDGGRMSNYVHDVGIIGMPYMADSYEEVQAITESATFKGFDDDFAAEGIHILAYNWYDGPRNFYTNKVINAPGDLAGQRIRTPGAPVWAESVAALGATPVAMPWTEAYNAIQSGSIDGAEVQSTSAFPASMWEVTKNMSRTEHFQLANFIMVGQKWFDTLPAEYQAILAEECKAAAAENAQTIIATATDFEKQMVEKGLIINEPDKAVFKQASDAAYTKLGFTELRDKIWSEIGKK